MKDSKILKGKEMQEILPGELLPKIEQAFRDAGMSIEKDMEACQVIYHPKYGSCFLMHGYVNEFSTGTLICTFKKDGTGFTWGKPYLHFFDKD